MSSRVLSIMSFALNQQNDRHDPILSGFHITFYQPASMEYLLRNPERLASEPRVARPAGRYLRATA
ncbi:MAG: hypothetical protein ACJ0BN_12275 [Limisphaerales bacterium]